MDLIVKKISNLVEQQFPAFYREEGAGFITFVKAYYEWLEQERNSLYSSRRFFEYRDIDETLEDFLVYFQKKYLYGIPFDVIINKRFLLKHVLDVYRSKGSEQAYKLLFKLIYDKEIEIYIPGNDLLRASDGTWKEPKYLEITNTKNASKLVGTTIYGLSSKTTAVVENFIVENIYEEVLTRLYISNITPKNGQFVIGEKIIEKRFLESNDIVKVVNEAPKIVGSLSSIEVVSGSTSFVIGDILKIAKKSLSNNQIISYGTDGFVKVSEVTRGRGQLQFTIANKGSGLTANAVSYFYRNELDSTGTGASFAINNLSDIQIYTYNTDLICDYLDITLNSSTYGFPANTSANSASQISNALTFANAAFGSILSLQNVKSGQNYTKVAYTFVRSTMPAKNTIPGNVSYNSTSANITGTSTTFTRFFANNDVIEIQANTSLANTIETHVIKQVVNNTVIVLYGAPTINSTASAKARVAADIMPSNFARYESKMLNVDGTLSGRNANVYAPPNAGNNVIKTAVAIDSGKGYVDGEIVKLYLYGSISNPTIVQAGNNYSNGDLLVFAGGSPERLAQGFVTTNSNGAITNVSISYAGAGYKSIPNILIKTNKGTGAVLATTVVEINPAVEIEGVVKKSGIGYQRGSWSTTRGFLNSDKYLQDSYFYQDFSYQIKTAVSLDKYKDILYDTFHIAGTELFGEYLVIDTVESPNQILFEQTTATLS